MENLVNFWFKKKNRKKWFFISKEFDNECSNLYKNLLYNFDNINVNNVVDFLGLIILLDQIPRNIYRGKKESFEYDKKCVEICLKNILFSDELEGWKKIFFLMPLKHSEDLEIQKYNIELWEKIIEKDNRELYKKNLEQCKKHYNIIYEFGRFPKRNKILGRVNSLKEDEYLKNNKNFI